jgi:hypothetical protein
MAATTVRSIVSDRRVVNRARKRDQSPLPRWQAERAVSAPRSVDRQLASARAVRYSQKEAHRALCAPQKSDLALSGAAGSRHSGPRTSLSLAGRGRSLAVLIGQLTFVRFPKRRVVTSACSQREPKQLPQRCSVAVAKATGRDVGSSTIPPRHRARE